jgi:hypothetical protein
MQLLERVRELSPAAGADIRMLVQAAADAAHGCGEPPPAAICAQARAARRGAAQPRPLPAPVRCGAAAR